MEQALKSEELIVNKAQLIDFFYQGAKSSTDFKIGIEFEKLPVNNKDFTAAPYSGRNGISEVLKRYKSYNNWKYVKEDSNILGLVNDFDAISLEPGSQFELSSYPEKTIHSIAENLNAYNSITSEIAEEINIYWLGYGIQPVSTYNDIELIPKRRYEIMTDYLPNAGKNALVMMRETAGIQISTDYDSELDAMKKQKAALLISPIVSAMFSNSPIRGGKDTGYKSYRAYSWLDTDNARCGLVSKDIFEKDDFSFSDYVNVLLDLPMIFIKKNHSLIKMKGMPFKDYLKNGYEGHLATMEDWFLHMNLFFPDVRLRNYVEIRNCDSQRSDLIPAAPAFWKGIMYNNDALDSVLELMELYNWNDINELRQNTPKYALDSRVNGIKAADLAKELINIADDSLKSLRGLNNESQDESIYLEPLKELIYSSKTPADVILDHWYSDWNQDISKLAEYSRLV